MRSFFLLRLWLLGVGLIIAGLAALDTIVPARAEKTTPALFNSKDAESRRLQPFQKWNGMLERQVNERTLYDGPCNAKRFNRCHLQEWRALLASLEGKDRRTQLAAVNAFMNKASYIEDMPNWGVPDYWATPLQFLTKEGDCEDYAIAKFVSLRTLGFSNDELRIAVVDDTNLQVPHAVLVVYLEGQALVLDNQIPEVVPSTVIRHYHPIYSINEDTWWLHTAQ